MPMDRDTRTYLLLIGLPAILITAAGLLLLLFGGRGLASEMRRSGYDEQFGRYERNMRQRLATRARAYVKDGGADHVWAKDASASNTNFSDRVKYGWFAGTNGAVIGWTRLEDGTIIGYDEKPFRYEDSPELYLLGIGFVMVLLLFFTLFAGGWRLAWTARRVREDLEVKNSFLDLISHELNTPLGSIVPLSSALADGTIKDERRRAIALDTLKRESSRMARMIGELLTVVRLRNGKFTFARESVDLRDVAESAARLLRCRYPDCVINVRQGAPVRAVADCDKVEQVAINLIENACRYAGGGLIEVQCRDCGDGMAAIDVMDRGEGVPRDRRERLFERFYQHDAERGGETCGLGLGLSIVAGFVKGMGGRVGVADRDGGGSVFTVALPAAASGKDGGRH